MYIQKWKIYFIFYALRFLLYKMKIFLYQVS